MRECGGPLSDDEEPCAGPPKKSPKPSVFEPRYDPIYNSSILHTMLVFASSCTVTVAVEVHASSAFKRSSNAECRTPLAS